MAPTEGGWGYVDESLKALELIPLARLRRSAAARLKACDMYSVHDKKVSPRTQVWRSQIKPRGSAAACVEVERMSSPRAGFRHSRIKPRRSAAACVELDEVKPVKVVMSALAVCRKVGAETRGMRIPLSTSSPSESPS